MSVFLFLDNPHGGVEDFRWLVDNAPWVSGVYCNVRDYAPEDWEMIIRPRALQFGLFCGAWGRTTDPTGQSYSSEVVDRILATSDRWKDKGIVNCEKEIDNNQAALESIVTKIGARSNISLSTQTTPFWSLDWSIAKHLVIHAQNFPADSGKNPSADSIRQSWWDAGIKCAFVTYGVYGGMMPGDFDLKAPYSLFTGDVIMSTYSVANWAPTSYGYVGCQSDPPGGGMKSLTEIQVPYTGPYGLPTGTLKSKGPTAEAVKRAMGHLKLFPWQDYDQVWNKALYDAFAKWKKSVGIGNGIDGSYGEKAWIKLRSATYLKNGKRLYALDPYARKLIQDEAGATAESTNEQKVMDALAEWGYAIIANEPDIHYDQDRPVTINVDPTTAFRSDCSGTVIQGYAYAKRKTGLKVPDPAKQNWTGYGNTDWYEDDHPHVASPYRIGDLAHFESPRHVIMCIKPGKVGTAEWVSHGWEGGPQLVVLSSYDRYPEEFIAVVRPPKLEE